MSFLQQLHLDSPVAYDLLIFSIVVIAGIALGNIRVVGIKLGVAGALTDQALGSAKELLGSAVELSGSSEELLGSATQAQNRVKARMIWMRRVPRPSLETRGNDPAKPCRPLAPARGTRRFASSSVTELRPYRESAAANSSSRRSEMATLLARRPCHRCMQGGFQTRLGKRQRIVGIERFVGRRVVATPRRVAP